MKSVRKTTINEETTTTDHNSRPEIVAYRVSQLEIAVKEGFKANIEKLDDLINSFATRGELSELRENHNIRIKKLEEWNVWVSRLVIGAVVLAVIAGIGLNTK